MAGRVLSIEIGYEVTRVIEIDYKVKNPKIYHFFAFETPAEMIEDDTVKCDQKFLEKMKQEMMQHNIRTKKVVFTVTSGRIANREIVIPLVRENRIHSLLVSNIADYFPVDLMQYQLVHEMISKDEKEKKMKLSVVAVPNDLLRSYRDLASYCGLSFTGIDYSGHSVYTCMKNYGEGEISVMIKIEERTTMLTVMKQKQVELQRTLAYGVDEIVETLQESRGSKDFMETIKILKQENCFHPHLEMEYDEGSISLAKDNEKDLVTEAAHALVSNIVRVIAYYISKNSQIKIDRVELIGLGSLIRGLDELLKNELNLPVMPLVRTGKINIPKNVEAEGMVLADAVACVGTAVEPLAIDVSEKGFKNQDKTGEEKTLVVPILVCSLCLVISLGLVGYSLGMHIVLNSRQTDLNNQINNLQSAQGIYDEYVNVKAEYDSMDEVQALITTPNDAFLTFLEEFQQNMPKDLVLHTLCATESGVVMQITTSSKTTAANVLVKLRKCETLRSVSIDDLTEVVLDDGTTQEESFTVTCEYVDSPVNTEEQTVENTDATDAEGATDTTDTADTADAEDTSESDIESLSGEQ